MDASRRDGLAAVVLAAGAGSRLRPLTEFRPKPLCPVGNVPLVDLAIERTRRHAGDVAVNVHHGRGLMEAHLAGRVHLSIEEPAPLGTAGAIGALREWIDGRDVLVLNGDAWHPDDLDPLVAGWDGERLRFAVVEAGIRGDFGTLRFAGASLMPWRVVRSLEPVFSGLYDTCWKPELARGLVDFVRSDAPFFDCGTVPDYHAANMASSGGESVVHPSAVVDGEVVRSVVWPLSVVRRGERLVDAIRVGEDVTVSVTGSGS